MLRLDISIFVRYASYFLLLPFRHRAAGRGAPRGLHEPDAPLRSGRPDGGVGAEPRHLRPHALARRHAALLEEQPRMAGGSVPNVQSEKPLRRDSGNTDWRLQEPLQSTGVG